MNLEDIEKENTGLEFKESITVAEYEDIMSNYGGEDIPVGFGFWKEYHPFNVHLLNHAIGLSFSIDEEEYASFLPILERYFLTDKEYDIIVKNVGFIKNDATTLYMDTPTLKVYSMMKMWNTVPTITELMSMNYKTFMKLHLYSLGDRFIMPLTNKEEGDYHR